MCWREGRHEATHVLYEQVCVRVLRCWLCMGVCDGREGEACPGNVSGGKSGGKGSKHTCQYITKDCVSLGGGQV